MTDFEKQLNKYAKSIKLSAIEKRELEARVVSFMEYHPRRERVAAAKAQAYLESQPYSIISFHNRYLQAALGALAVFVLIIVPTVAEQSVPGDVLYPIKVRVNEEVRGSLTFSPAQKIEWETERLERRISEVRLLESRGELTEETEAEAVKAVQAHVDAVQNSIDELRGTDAGEASLAEVAFESALDVQTFVLESDETEDNADDSEESSGGLASVVRLAKEAAVASKGDVTASHEKIVARLEVETTRAYELFESLDGTATDEEKAEIERRLSDIERKIRTGVSEHESGIKSERLINALSDTRKLISFMTDIDVRNSVPLEILIPIELTEEEKSDLINENKAMADKVIEKVEALEEGVVDSAVMEKIAMGVETLQVLNEHLTEANQQTDLDTKLTISQEMKIVATDIEKLLLPFTADMLEAETEGESNNASSTATTTEEVVATTTKEVSTTTNEAESTL